MALLDHQLLAALMETVPDRIYFKDEHSRFLRVNRATREFMGVKGEEEILGKSDHDFFSLIHADAAFLDEKQILTTGQPIIAKMEREVRLDGRVSWVSTTKVALRNEEGVIIGICGISRDIAEEHARTEGLTRYIEELGSKQLQMDQELALAGQIQLALLPQRYPSFPPGAEKSAFSFSHLYLPNSQVGGDFFTVIPVSSHEAGVLICDVMGHGVPAALVTGVQRSLVDDLRPWADDPGIFLRELNRRLCQIFENVQTPLLVTAFYMVVDACNGEVRFANAAHPHPLHLSREKNEVRVLGGRNQAMAFALGMAEDSTYQTLVDFIGLGDRLLLFTDGLCDLEGESILMRDDERFISLVHSCDQLQGVKYLRAIIDRVREFAGNLNFFDDVCLVSVDWERRLEDQKGFVD